MTKFTTAFSAAAIATLLLAGCSGGSSSTSTSTTSGAQPEVTDIAMMETSMGTMEIELYGKDAPKAVENFVTLANQGFYKNILFHRVVPGFVIQAGDPKTKDASLVSDWGTGGNSIYPGILFPDELNPQTPSYKLGYREGCLAMANSGPNTNTSQFFIVLDDNVKERLPHNYTIFGFVRSGMDVAHKIEGVKLGGATGQMPMQPVKIINIEAGKE
ncbi:MAG: peptidylprolyl isomerase [Armatimonadetes bacterium]|nr:peptidylprolyl isomerase [Armatimonadota bacterium]